MRDRRRRLRPSVHMGVGHRRGHPRADVYKKNAVRNVLCRMLVVADVIPSASIRICTYWVHLTNSGRLWGRQTPIWWKHDFTSDRALRYLVRTWYESGRYGSLHSCIGLDDPERKSPTPMPLLLTAFNKALRIWRHHGHQSNR